MLANMRIRALYDRVVVKRIEDKETAMQGDGLDGKSTFRETTMPGYDAPIRELRFLLEDVFRYDEKTAVLPGFEDATLDVVMAVLDGAATFAQSGGQRGALGQLSGVSKRRQAASSGSSATDPTVLDAGL